MNTTEASPTLRRPEPPAIRLRAELPALTAGARQAAAPRGALHDFLVLSPRPDLTPELFPPAIRPPRV